jgi:hypothetical protein
VFDRNRLRRDPLRRQRAWAISIWRATKEQLISATQDAEHETWSASSFGALLTSPYTHCIGGIAPAFKIRVKIEVDFFSLASASGNFVHNHPKVVPGKAKKPPGNRVASSLGRIVPTEAKPSELSGEILSLAKYRVKAKTRPL